MVKYMNSPVASTRVLMNGAEMTAGSMPALGQKGDQGTDRIGPHADAQERQADHCGDAPGLAAAEAGIRTRPLRASCPGKSPISHSRSKTRQRVAPLDLAQGEPADDGADGLAAGIAPGAEHERDEVTRARGSGCRRSSSRSNEARDR